jgi:hypothetical protein
MSTKKYDSVPTLLEGAAAAPGGTTAFVPSVEERKNQRYEDGDFIVEPNVALFDAHDGHEEDLDIVFDEGLLQKIVDNTMRKIADTGDMPPVYCGHLDDAKPEYEQGELLGFVDDLRLGEIGNLEPRACIYGTIKWRKDKVDMALEYPRRSIELSLDVMEIDNLAALKSRPQRNLGVLYKKVKGKVARYARYLKEQDMTEYHIPDPKLEAPKSETPWVKEIMTHLMELPQMKWCEEQMKKMSAEDKPEEVKVEVDESHEDEEEHEGPEKLKAQRNQSRRQYAKLLASHKSLEERLAKMEKAATLATRRADLIELEASGVQFDIGEELDYVADLDNVKYGKHLARMAKNYNKAPIGVTLQPSLAPDESTKNEVSSNAHEVYSKHKYSHMRTEATKPGVQNTERRVLDKNVLNLTIGGTANGTA